MLWYIYVLHCVYSVLHFYISFIKSRVFEGAMSGAVCILTWLTFFNSNMSRDFLFTRTSPNKIMRIVISDIVIQASVSNLFYLRFWTTTCFTMRLIFNSLTQQVFKKQFLTFISLSYFFWSNKSAWIRSKTDLVITLRHSKFLLAGICISSPICR